jgi:hypothetical protein
MAFAHRQYVWSGEAVEDSRLIFLPGAVIRTLIARLPSFALCWVDGLVAKGNQYIKTVIYGKENSMMPMKSLSADLRRDHSSKWRKARLVSSS